MTRVLRSLLLLLASAAVAAGMLAAFDAARSPAAPSPLPAVFTPSASPQGGAG